MKFFHYRKWFFDVFTGEGDYTILFVSVIKVGLKNYAFLQIYSAGNQNNDGYSNFIKHEISLLFKEENTSAIIFDAGWIDIKENTIEIQFYTTELTCQLIYTSDEKSARNPLCLKTSRHSILKWKPLLLKSTVTGNLQVQGKVGHQFSTEIGYSDWVETNIFPLKVPVQKLYWGRIQNTVCCLSWSVIKGKKGKSYSKMFLLFNGTSFEFDEPKLVIQKEKPGVKQSVLFPERFILKGKNENLTVIVTVFSHEEILGNNFMDYAKKYGKTVEELLRYFSRNPRGIKFWAQATLEIFKPGMQPTRLENLTVIDEFVCFNK